MVPFAQGWWYVWNNSKLHLYDEMCHIPTDNNMDHIDKIYSFLSEAPFTNRD